MPRLPGLPLASDTLKTDAPTSSRLPLEQVAGILAPACGPVGSCAEYLFNTVRHLEEFGIHDRNLWHLQKLVAAEIERLHRTCQAAE